MTNIRSNYIGREFPFNLITYQRSDGPVSILKHDDLFDIIQNQISGENRVTYHFEFPLVSAAHCFAICTMTDGTGRTVQECGESMPETLTTFIAKNIPATMAAIRAFDRAAIKFLDLDCKGKAYSDQEIPEKEIQTALKNHPSGPESVPAAEKPKGTDIPNKKTKPDTVDSMPAVPRSERPVETDTGTWGNSELRDQILKALDEHDEVIVFDTETTGLSVSKDRIVEISAQKFKIETDKTLTLIDELHQYIKPPFPMPEKAAEINGITDELLEDQPAEEDAFVDIYRFFGERPQILSGYNSPFDIRFLSDMYKRQEKTLLPQAELDVCKMAKDKVRMAENYKLETIAGIYGMKGDDFHTASADTDYTAKLLGIFIQDYRKELNGTPSDKTGTEKNRPEILSMELFAPSSTVRRIYVNTSLGTVFYNIPKKCWQAKNADINNLDMDYIEQEAWKNAGVDSQQAFEKFTGKWNSSEHQAA